MKTCLCVIYYDARENSKNQVYIVYYTVMCSPTIYPIKLSHMIVSHGLVHDVHDQACWRG